MSKDMNDFWFAVALWAIGLIAVNVLLYCGSLIIGDLL